jgi:hypothetical protein
MQDDAGTLRVNPPGRGWRRLVFVHCALILMTLPGRAASAQVLGRYELGSGWATFGLVLPAGAATGGVRVGSLTTQTDVKSTWPDGSIRFAVVTALVGASGSYNLEAAARPGGTFLAAWPSATVSLTVGGTRWVAELPGAPTHGVWLSGPLVSEGRAVVVPRANGVGHAFLRVVFDVRSYNGGGHRLDVTVENVLNVAETDKVIYDVAIAIGGNVVFGRNGVSHPSFARWRKVFGSNLREASIVPDFTSFHQARALPEYLRSVWNAEPEATGDRFDILTLGELAYPMDQAGGRDEIGPYPAWVARYLVHRKPRQREYVLRHGDNAAGAWSIHVTEPDGSLVAIDRKPNFWLGRHSPSPNTNGIDGPANGHRGIRYEGEVGSAHAPSLAYVPYLLTGDRFYLDEMKFWANHALISVHDASDGVVFVMTEQGEVRGSAWALRNMADAAAYTPDGDPDKRYFRTAVERNLESFDEIARRGATDRFGALFIGRGTGGNRSMIAPWQQAYVAWAIAHAQRQGFGPAGGVCLRRIIGYTVDLYNAHPAFHRDYIPSYMRWVLTAEGTPFAGFAELFQYNFGGPKPRLEKPRLEGIYDVEFRLQLLLGVALQIDGAQRGLDALLAYREPDGTSVVDDVDKRAQWALTLAGVAPGSAVPVGPSPPAAPTRVRVVP